MAFDCAIALNKVFVARVDEHEHYMVQPVTIENGEVTARLGYGTLVLVPDGLNMLNYLYSKKKYVGLRFRVEFLKLD